MAKRPANTQIIKDSSDDGEGLWGSGAQTSGPPKATAAQLASRKMARPRARRPVGNLRSPTITSGQSQQFHLPDFPSSNSAATSSNTFAFGQQANGTMNPSASFPPFGTANGSNTNQSGASSSFNIPTASSFSFNMGQSNAVTNPFASHNTPRLQNENSSTNSQNSIFNIPPSQQGSSAPSIFSQTSQPNGTSSTPSQPSQNLFSPMTSSPQQSQDQRSSAYLFLQPDVVQQQQTRSFGQPQTETFQQMPSNPFGSGNNSENEAFSSKKRKEPENNPSSSIFGTSSQPLSNIPSSANIFSFGKTSSTPAEVQPKSNNIFGQSLSSTPQTQKPSFNIFGQPSGTGSQQTSQANNIFASNSNAATSQPVQATSIFSNSKSAQTQSNPPANIFGQSSTTQQEQQSQSPSMFSNSFTSKPEQPSSQNSEAEQHQNSPAPNEWKPTTNLWGEDSSKRTPRPLEDIFGSRKPNPVEQFQANADTSMMETSPDNSPQAKQKTTDARPFAFLNSESRQAESSPTKASNAPLGKSIFDRVSTAAQADPPTNASATASSSIFGQSPKTPSQGSQQTNLNDGITDHPSSLVKPAEKAQTQNTAKQISSESPKFNPFANIKVPPTAQAQSQVPTPSKTPSLFSQPTSTNAKASTASMTPGPSGTHSTPGINGLTRNTGNVFAAAEKIQKAATESPFKSSNEDQANSPFQPPPHTTSEVNTASSVPSFSTQSTPNFLKPADHGGAQNNANTLSLSSNGEVIIDPNRLQVATTSLPEENAAEQAEGISWRLSEARKMIVSKLPFNPMVIRVRVPNPPIEFTDQEKIQFITGWRLKHLDNGVQGFLHDNPLSDWEFEKVKEFYRLKRQAIFAANGASMDDLDPLTGEKRKADDSTDGPNKRARIENSSTQQFNQAPSGITPGAATSTAQSPSESPTSPNGVKRKADDSIAEGDAQRHTSPSKRVRPSQNDISPPKHSFPASQTSGMFKDILQNDKFSSPTASAASAHESTSQTTPTPSFVPSAGVMQNAKSPFQISNPGPQSPNKATASAPLKVPNFGAKNGTNFMSQFGNAAKKQEEKDKAKRKADDYDSDEEDEASWERRDAEEQRKKKQKFEEAAKPQARFVPGKGFSFHSQPDGTASEISDGEVSNSSRSIFDTHQQARPASSSFNFFGNLSDVDSGREGSKTGDADDENEGEDESEEEINHAKMPLKKPSPSLFDRVSKDEKGNPVRDLSVADSTPAKPLFGTPNSNIFKNTPSANSNIFGATPTSTTVNPFKPFSATNVTPTSSEKGDHTWKPTEPIKFSTDGASDQPSVNITSPSPPKASLGSLFGTFKPNSSAESSSKTPSASNSTPGASNASGFGFGISPPKPISNSLAPPSNITSRATSPGLTTGESANESNADGEDEGAEKHEQIDLTLGGPGEEDEDVMFEARAKTSQWDEDSKEWVTKGVGPFRILKNRENGDIRMLMRQDPSGRVLINSAIFSGVDYKTEVKNTTRIPIVSQSGKLETWIVKVGKEEDALAMSALLEENKQKK